jgi:tRNA-dihydrouridine synthase A
LARVKAENPKLTIVMNGGIQTLDEAEAHLLHVDGVMLGRAAYHNPAMLAEVDARFFGGETVAIEDAVERYLDYVAHELTRGVPLNAMTKHMLGLFNGRPGARLFRRHLSENATRPAANVQTLRDALAHLDQSSNHPPLEGGSKSLSNDGENEISGRGRAWASVA